MGLVHAVYPEQCALCSAIGEPAICSDCRLGFLPAAGPVVMPHGSPLSLVHSVFAYTGHAAWAVQRLKFAQATALAAPLAEDLAAGFAELGAGRWDAVVPVPIHWSRRAWRGFNQSDLLCEKLPPELVKPWLVRRTKATKPQSLLSGAERRRNIEGAFRADPQAAGRSILLVDDVFTSGSTLEECAKALKLAGAVSIEALTLCGERQLAGEPAETEPLSIN